MTSNKDYLNLDENSSALSEETVVEIINKVKYKDSNLLTDNAIVRKRLIAKDIRTNHGEFNHIKAESANYKNLHADTINIQKNNIKEAFIEQVEIKDGNISINKLFALNAKFKTLELEQEIQFLKLKELEVEKAKFRKLEIEEEIIQLRIKELQVQKAILNEAIINSATATNINIISGNANLDNIKANHAKFDKIQVKCLDLNEVELEHLKSKKASIIDANIRNADIQYSKIQEAAIGNIQSKNFETYNAVIDEATIRCSTIKKLKVTDLEFDNITTQHKLNIDNAVINNLDMSKALADYADISELESNKAKLEEANIKHINVHSGNIRKVNIDKADINDLSTKNINLINLHAQEANFDNITVKNSLVGLNEIESKTFITTPLLNAEAINVKNLNIDIVDFNPNIEKVYLTFQDELYFMRDGKEVLSFNKDGVKIKNDISPKYKDPTPIGAIIAFFGKDIPEGWILCDGKNGTPDLREKLIFETKDVDVQISLPVATNNKKDVHKPSKHLNYIMKVK